MAKSGWSQSEKHYWKLGTMMLSKIILADDDAMFRLLMRQNLTALGFEVIEETSGKKVLQHVKQISPVACIIDIVMDEKEGLQTIAELNELPAKPKLIAVSSNPLYLDLAKTLGADAILAKPVMQKQLEMTLSALNIAADLPG